MKTLQNILPLVVLITLYTFCKLNTDMKQMLSKQRTGTEITNAQTLGKKGVAIMLDNQKPLLEIHESNIEMLPVTTENRLLSNIAVVN